jgi:hypothetical protein
LRRRCPEIHVIVKYRTREIPIHLVEKFVRIPGRCIGALLFRANKFALNGFFVPFVDIVLIPFHLDVPGAGYTCDTRRMEIALIFKAISDHHNAQNTPTRCIDVNMELTWLNIAVLVLT